MDASLSLEDLLHVAERMERRGALFYQRAAEACPDAAGQKVLAGLAEMEGQHEQVFSVIREHVLNLKGPRGKTVRAGAHAHLVFDILISGMMEDLQGRFHAKTTTQDILREAIVFEKDTVVFLAQLGETIENPSDRKKVQMVLREELSHIFDLSRQLIGDQPRRSGTAMIQATA